MANSDDTKKAIDTATDDFVEFCRTAKREVITLSPEAFDALVAMLEAPPKANARLRALAARTPPWDSN
jgi:hypothetical protein